MSFVNVIITRQLEKDWKAHIKLAKEVFAFADQNGVFNLCEQILENWRKANRPILNKNEMRWTLISKINESKYI